jgi:hypothetical protein
MPQHGVVRLVRDAAERVVGKNNAVTGIDRVHDRPKDAEIGFSACHDLRICPELIEYLSKTGSTNGK